MSETEALEEQSSWVYASWAWTWFSSFSTILGIASFWDNLKTWRDWITNAYNWLIDLTPSWLEIVLSIFQIIPWLIDLYRSVFYPIVELTLPFIEIDPRIVDFVVVVILTLSGSLKFWFYARLKWDQTVAKLEAEKRLELKEQGKGFVPFFFIKFLERSPEMQHLRKRLKRIRFIGTLSVFSLLIALFAVDYYVQGSSEFAGDAKEEVTLDENMDKSELDGLIE